jgi:hypothetical protein
MTIVAVMFRPGVVLILTNIGQCFWMEEDDFAADPACQAFMEKSSGACSSKASRGARSQGGNSPDRGVDRVNGAA